MTQPVLPELLRLQPGQTVMVSVVFVIEMAWLVVLAWLAFVAVSALV